LESHREGAIRVGIFGPLGGGIGSYQREEQLKVFWEPANAC